MQSWKPVFAIIVATALALAGCLDPTGSDGEGGSATMAPDSSASLPLILEDAGWDLESVTVSVQESAGLDVTPSQLHDTGNNTLAGWVQFTAPADADEGDHDVVVTVDSGDGETRNVEYTLNVEQPESPIEEGQQVSTHVSARTQEGELVLTTQQDIANASLPHSEAYQPSQQFDPLPLPAMHGANLFEEVVDGLIASGEGHTVTVEVPEFFGATTIEDDLPRTETVARDSQEQRFIEIPRPQAEQQGFVSSDAQEGDPVDLPQIPLDYVIEEFRDGEQGETVVIRADVDEGDRVTLQEAWPEAAEVTELDDEAVHLYVTPPQQEGDRFTWVEGWDDATEITRMNETVIEVRHSPEEGLTYEETNPETGEEAEVTVIAVDDETITVSRVNLQPHAGETILLDMTIVEILEDQMGQPGPGQQQPQP